MIPSVGSIVPPLESRFETVVSQLLQHLTRRRGNLTNSWLAIDKIALGTMTRIDRYTRVKVDTVSTD